MICWNVNMASEDEETHLPSPNPWQGPHGWSSLSQCEPIQPCPCTWNFNFLRVLCSPPCRYSSSSCNIYIYNYIYMCIYIFCIYVCIHIYRLVVSVSWKIEIIEDHQASHLGEDVYTCMCIYIYIYLYISIANKVSRFTTLKHQQVFIYMNRFL